MSSRTRNGSGTGALFPASVAFDIVQFKEGRLCGCCGPVITKVACATALMLVTLLLPIVLVFGVINQLEPGSQVCLSARLVTDDHTYHARLRRSASCLDMLHNCTGTGRVRLPGHEPGA